MIKVTVLGCGMIGKTIAEELSYFYEVTCIDKNPLQLDKLKSKGKGLKKLLLDLNHKGNVLSVIEEADFVVSAVPGFMGFNTLKTIIESGKNVVDISFFAEDPFELDELARQKNITAIVDCGISPGFSGIILGHFNKKMKIDSYECLVGGIPLNPKPPFFYKAPFSPIDVIEEYTRPARIIENGKLVIKEPLTGLEILEFEPIGYLEAFYTDGLRTLLKTMRINNMMEKTLRHPGHAFFIKKLKEIGLFDKREVLINGTPVIPIEFISKILFDHWKLENGEKECTILRVILSGESKKIQFDLYDEYDSETNTTSMARTTGYTCTAALHALVNNLFVRKGICPPEFLGEDEHVFNHVVSYLKEKGISIKQSFNSVN